MLRAYLPLEPAQFCGPAALALLSLACTLIGNDLLAYERAGIASGELWRLVAANLAHINPEHAALNLGGVLVLWILHGDDYNTRDYLLLALFCSVAVTAGLYLASEDITWYAGLSGVLHGIFAWGVAHDFRAHRMTAWFLGAGLVVKLLVEQELGGSPATEAIIGAAVVTDAHLYGAAAGSLASVAVMARENR